MSLRGSENPNLLPKGAVTVRMHSVGGWGAVTTGKNLAMTLFDLLGFDIRANPKYGSEKKGQPTTYFLLGRARADPAQLRVHLCRRGPEPGPQCLHPFQSAVRAGPGRRLRHPVAVWRAPSRCG